MNKLLSTTALLLTLTFSTAAFAHDDWYGKEGSKEPLCTESAVSKLPPKKAAEFRENMKGAYDENKGLWAKKQQLHKELHAIIVAPDFDADAFIAKSNELRDLHDKMEANRTAAFATSLSNLNQKERISLVSGMHKGHETHHGKWSHVTKDGTHGDATNYTSQTNDSIKGQQIDK